MKLLIVSQYFWPEGFRINEIAKTLSEKQVNVDVLTGKPNYPGGKIFPGYSTFGNQYENYHGINITRIPLLSRGRSGWRLALNYISFVITGLIFAPWLFRRKKYDVIFVYAPSPILQAIPAIFLGWLKQCPVVLWVQDLWPESLSATGYIQNNIVLLIIKRIVRFIYDHTDLILVQSEAFVEPVLKIASSTPIRFYPNSVDDSFTIPAETKIPYVEELSDGFSVMFAGNIGTAQAVGVIVEAADILREYSEIRLVVLGDGSSRGWMIDQVDRRKLTNLHLPGRFPVEMMPAFMQKASALLVTLANQPIFAVTVPNKIQAYMASGRPILASLNGEGARLIVESGSGIATPAEDAQALANAILKLYKLSPEERKIMGDNGRCYYKKHFDHNTLIDKLIDYFHDISNNIKGT